MGFGSSDPGFLILDATLNPLASNAEAINILTFPNAGARIKRLEIFLADKIRSSLLERGSNSGVEFVGEFKSGRRCYLCRTFRLDNSPKSSSMAIIVLLERKSSAPAALVQISEQFALTDRERQTVELLLQGLTSKEIAARMSISPNTVKAFLRLVMVKMGVSTRSGIVGRIVGPPRQSWQYTNGS